MKQHMQKESKWDSALREQDGCPPSSIGSCVKHNIDPNFSFSQIWHKLASSSKYHQNLGRCQSLRGSQSISNKE